MQPRHPFYFFAAKCVFRVRALEEGKPVRMFEERIVLVKCRKFDDAFKKAEKVGRKYAKADNTKNRKTTFLACVGVYIIQDPIEDGVEIFSMLRVSDMPDKKYLKQHYQTGSEFDSFLFRSEPGLCNF